MSGLDVVLRLRLANMLSKESKVAAKDLQKLGAAGQKLNGKGAGRFGQDLKAASLASGRMTVNINQMSAATRRMSGDLRMAGTVTGRLGSSFGKVASSAKQAAQASKEIGKGAGLKKARAEADALAKSYDRLGRAARKGASGAGGEKKSRGRDRSMRDEALAQMGGNAYLLGGSKRMLVGAGIGMGALGVAGAMRGAVREAISFDAAMADVKKKVDLAAGADWGDVEAMIYKVARATGHAAGDVAALTAQAGQSGIVYNDLEQFAMLAAKAASAWDMDTKEASQKLAEIKAQTNWTIPQMEEFADKVNALGDAGAAAERNIVEMFQRASAAAKTAGVDFDTTLAITTALRSTGMNEEVAARFWGAFTGKLRTSTSQGKKAQEGYKMLGMTAKQVEKGMKTDSLKTMLTVLEKLQNHPDSATAAIKLFGQEWWDEAARGGQAIPEMLKNIQLLAGGKWKGSLQQNLAIELDTTENRLKRIKVVVSEIGQSFGSWALPAINSSIDALLTKLEAYFEKQKKLEEAAKLGKQQAEGKPLTSDEAAKLDDPKAKDAADEANRTHIGRVIQQNNQAHVPTTNDQVNNIRNQIDQVTRDLAQLESEAKAALQRAGGAGIGAVKAEIEKKRRIQADLKELLAEAEKGPKSTPGFPAVADRAGPGNIDEFIGKMRTLGEAFRQIKFVPEGEKGTLRVQIEQSLEVANRALQSGDLSEAGRKALESYIAAIKSEDPKVRATAASLLENLKATLGQKLYIDIEPRMSGVPLPSVKPAAPAGGGGKKSASLGGGGGGISIAQVNVHGVRDVAGLQRQITAAADRAARGRRDNSLHDIDSGSIG